jgi:hypothetical protein
MPSLPNQIQRTGEIDRLQKETHSYTPPFEKYGHSAQIFLA